MATKGLSNYKINKIKNNLRKFYSMADDDQINRGKDWYPEANRWCKKVAEVASEDPEIVAEVLSALSPRNKWDKNKIDAQSVLFASKKGKGPDSVRVSTFNNNKNKAFSIAKGELRIKENSPKTYAFVKNISELDPDYVTVDVWHLRACFDVLDTSKALPNLTTYKYKQIERATLDVAKEYNLKGYEFQAIVWNCVRES